MNREIKFRLWNTVRKDMNYDGGMAMLGNKLIQDDHNILMQFTELKDKNGKEIYEGDIVKIEEFVGKQIIGKIIFYDYMWQIFEFKEDSDEKDYTDYIWIRDYILEVIGNIYENSELLKDVNVENDVLPTP